MTNTRRGSPGFSLIELLIVLLIVGLLYVGPQVIPLWLVELILSIGWFAFQYFFIKWLIRLSILSKGYFQEYKTLLVWGYQTQIVAAYILRFYVLRDADIAYFHKLGISYLGTYVIFFVLPLAGIWIFHPLFHPKKEAAKWDAKTVKKIALQCVQAQKFYERYPKCRIYVFDHPLKDRYVHCVFTQRIRRHEREDLFEDRLLEVPVDWKKRTVWEEEIQQRRYIFQSGENGSTVLELPAGDSYPRKEEPLEEESLQRFDDSFNRFPSLDSAPLPAAIQRSPYEIV
ncbi:MAG: prepilin-type N-terminal cleavage/methylation domain-containing protein [Candidatus Omnitrophota bacterium]